MRRVSTVGPMQTFKRVALSRGISIPKHSPNVMQVTSVVFHGITGTTLSVNP